MAIAKPSPSPPRSRSRRRSPPARDGRSRPTGPPTAEANVPTRAGQLAQYAADGVLGARARLTAARNQERLFASEVTADGPIWPHGAPTLPRSFSSQKPDNCSNAANCWIPASGRSRTRTWDLFLIRKTFCPLQSPQLALNPCKHVRRRQRKGTGEDWRGQAGGPIVAARPPFEGMVSRGPVAVIMPTIRSSPDAPEAGGERAAVSELARDPRNRRGPPLQRADPRLQHVQIRREGAQKAVKMPDASRDQVRPDGLRDIAHHPSRPGGPLPPNPRQKRDAGLAKLAPPPGARRGDLLSPGARDVRQPPPQAPIMEPGSGVEATGERRCLIVHRVNDQYSTNVRCRAACRIGLLWGRSHGEPEVQAWGQSGGSTGGPHPVPPGYPDGSAGLLRNMLD